MVTTKNAVDLIDFFVIAEEVLDLPTATIQHMTDTASAESALAAPYAGFGGVDLYPEPVQRAAILCSRIIRNHPVPDGNKRIGYLAMLEQLAREGYRFDSSAQDHIADVILALAAREISEDEFVDWVRDRVR